VLFFSCVKFCGQASWLDGGLPFKELMFDGLYRPSQLTWTLQTFYPNGKVIFQPLYGSTWHGEEEGPPEYPRVMIQLCGCWFLNPITGWWFGTVFIFPYIGNNHPTDFHIFQRG